MFAVVLLIALRTSPLPGRWPRLIGAIAVIGSLAAYLTSLSGSRVGTATEDLWKALLHLTAAIMVVRRVLARPTVIIQSIYGALCASSSFFADNQPANTQRYQYFSFITWWPVWSPPTVGPNAPERPGVAGYRRMLTALETTRIATSSEMASSAIIMSLAHPLMADTSVGLNAVAAVNDRCR